MDPGPVASVPIVLSAPAVSVTSVASVIIFLAFPLSFIYHETQLSGDAKLQLQRPNKGDLEEIEKV